MDAKEKPLQFMDLFLSGRHTELDIDFKGKLSYNTVVELDGDLEYVHKELGHIEVNPETPLYGKIYNVDGEKIGAIQHAGERGFLYDDKHKLVAMIENMDAYDANGNMIREISPLAFDLKEYPRKASFNPKPVYYDFHVA